MTQAQDFANLSQAYSTGGALNFRNRFLNGGHGVVQRAAAIACPAAAMTFLPQDHWYGYPVGSAITVDANAGPGPRNRAFLHAVGAAGNTSMSVGQRIESLYSWDLAGRPVTLSGWFFTTVARALTFGAATPNAADDWTAGTWATGIPTLPAFPAAAWTYFAATFDAPTTATRGMSIEFQVAAFTSGEIGFCNLQLEPGSIATPFEYRPYTLENALLERYFEKSYDAWTAPGTASSPAGREEEFRNPVVNSSQFGTVRFKTPKRAVPDVSRIIIYSDTTGAAGMASQSNGSAVGVGVSQQGTKGFRTNWTNNNGQFGAAYHWTADAELR